MNETRTLPSSSIVINSKPAAYQFSVLPELISVALAETSRKVYRNTYCQWTAFAKRNGIDAFDLSFENIYAFLSEGEISHSTRQSKKTHMLRLLDWHKESETRGEWYGTQRRRVLKFAKMKHTSSKHTGRRSHRALSKTEVAQLLEVWAADNRHSGVRNYALLRLLIYTGLRSAEVVALRWEDIDLDAQLVRVRHGKGDKERVVAIADVSDNTKQSLVALRALQADQYECVFPRLTNGPNPQFAADIPMHALTIYRVLVVANKRTGIGHLSAHDLRRTHITLALENGALLQDMQAQAGHASASTTMLYAMPSDAKTRRERIAF